MKYRTGRCLLSRCPLGRVAGYQPQHLDLVSIRGSLPKVSGPLGKGMYLLSLQVSYWES